MAQNDLVKVGGAFVVGAAIAVALVAAAFDVNLFGDTETGVTLSVIKSGAGCVLSGKETEAHVRRNKKLIWKIRNYCTDGAKTVIVGNFRTSPDPVSATDCSAPTSAAVDYPFVEQDLAARSKQVEAGETESNGSIDPGEDKLKLKVKDLNIPDGQPSLTYYYDLCVGSQKFDPRLEVER
jgi:hypothetical protein